MAETRIRATDTARGSAASGAQVRTGPGVSDALRLLSLDAAGRDEEAAALRAEVARLAAADSELRARLAEAEAEAEAARAEHRAEAERMRARAAALEERLRGMLAEDAARDRGAVEEMGGQLAAACKLIERLKTQLAALAAEAAELRTREGELRAQVAAMEEEAGRAAATVGGRAADATDAHRKVSWADRLQSARPESAGSIQTGRGGVSAGRIRLGSDVLGRAGGARGLGHGRCPGVDLGGARYGEHGGADNRPPERAGL